MTSEETIIFVSTAYLAAARWFEVHLIPWTLDDFKPFSQQTYCISIIYNWIWSHPQIPIEIHSNAKSFSLAFRTTWK